MTRLSAILVSIAICCCSSLAAERQTHVSIVGNAFHINGRATYFGRTWNGTKIDVRIEDQSTARPQHFGTVCFSGPFIHGQHLQEDACGVPMAYREQDAAALSHPV